MIDMNKKVVIAMSGGVDSSLAAALLKEAGFDVVGIFMKFWNPKICSSENRCCSSESEKTVRSICKKLKMPFYVFNFEKEFKKKVVDYFLKEYKSGKTPNPCVVCNYEIKFGLLMKKALSLGADFIATGHYARIKNNSLLKGIDKEKDQSYFLWKLNKKQLSRVLFPIGGYTKPEVREMAKKFGLCSADRKESQEVCFINNTVNDFLAKYFKPRIGDIIDTNGKILAKHNGLWFYTIGQRKGIKLSAGPYYVVGKDVRHNYLVVSKNKKELLKIELTAKNVNWISRDKFSFPLMANAKIRYRSEYAPAKLYKLKNNRVRVVFKKPQKAITPGQSVVFYKGQELIGGGIII
jgi:tRNA-specific 2-thiouridylase